MPPGESWLSFVPGFHALGEWIESHGNSWLFGNPVHVQHIFSIILVAVVMALLSLTASRQLSAAGSDIRAAVEKLMDIEGRLEQFRLAS